MHKTTLSIALALLLPVISYSTFAASVVADAAEKRDFDSVALYLNEKADVLEAQTDGSTALHWAVYWDNLEIARALIDAGADVEAASRLGATPIALAAGNGNSAMILLLLDAGSDAKATVLQSGETPLMLAARAGDVESVKVLLDAGAELDAVDTYRGATALLWASEQNHAAVVQLLVEHGANLNARTRTVVTEGRRGPSTPEGGLTGLMLATREGGLDTVKVLLAAKALVNQHSNVR